MLVCAVLKEFSEEQRFAERLEGYVFPHGSYGYLVVVTVCGGFW